MESSGKRENNYEALKTTHLSLSHTHTHAHFSQTLLKLTAHRISFILGFSKFEEPLREMLVQGEGK